MPKNGMRADLDEHPMPCFDDLPQRLVEQHRLANVPVPVGRIQLGSRQRRAGDRGVEWRRRRPRPDVPQAFHQLAFELLHFRAVIRHVHLQARLKMSAAVSVLSISARAAASPDRVTERAPLTAAIEMAPGYRSTRREASCAGDSHRQHGTLTGRTVLQTAAVESDANGILERQRRRRCSAAAISPAL